VGYGDNFLDFNPLWISLALVMFVIQKLVFIILLYRHGSFRILRGVSFMFFLLFYVLMIVTTFYSSPETKHHQLTPCTSKGTFVGQLIYWPLFLIIVFYIERGSYTFIDKIGLKNFGAAILTYIISALFFLVPILTITGWEGDSDTAISRMTCLQTDVEEDVVGCTGGRPDGIKLRVNLERNEFTPGSGMNPITFTGRHLNTGINEGALWGFVVGTGIAYLVIAYIGITNANNTRKWLGGARFLTGVIYGGVVGASSGAISGWIVEGRLAKMKGIHTRFEYLDENGSHVARVEAGVLENVPLNTTPIWKECTQDQQATSSTANNNCSNNNNTVSQTPPITYTPPGHCKYIADLYTGFSNYPDTETEKHYQLMFNTIDNTKAYIHFKQKPADDPIYGQEAYIYWFIFFAFLIAITFLIQALLLFYGSSTLLSKDEDPFPTTNYLAKLLQGAILQGVPIKNVKIII
jgi:hypothetical protein